ncbi:MULTISPECIES: petrobactin biosynthesis protein AsbD [Bacillus]|jgi:aryl carrier protein AsbD|uniref:Acyl carrier protein n=1 Tax=Bacillus cereus TaxID=1396 RepID=A0A9X3FFU4_BACCE|nr:MULTISPECIES: petrobactin biosynthesis protein AsbD [Bacillus]ANN32068.1 acyl carrier protein [Bacillus thuringiensis serovar coreanensis]OUB28838.1 acyl carrier protein [Bacillus thuringiensis serovar yunnanensis]WIK97715.1 petrobactin biosynthesis protein AsbD [Bacillus bombysepticus]EKS7858280.1 petrobactin biosynthesis protein AsbD [Bacillus cereus]KAB7655732.1 petrobactin biosynthesis protein AsbD [Bacillus sp. B2-WWTP-C-10-Post-4]
MRREALKNAVLKIMIEKMELKNVTHLEETMRLNQDLYIDSVMMLQLIVYIEMDVKLCVPEDEVDPKAFLTVGSLLDFMEELQEVNVNN